MRIQWKLDKESDIDPDYLLASVRVSDDKGNLIRDDCIYLDSFFHAFAEGLLKIELIESDHSYTSYLFDDPMPIIFSRHGGSLTIAYGDDQLHVSYEEAVNEFCRSYRALKDRMVVASQGEPWPDLAATMASLCEKC